MNFLFINNAHPSYYVVCVGVPERGIGNQDIQHILGIFR
uniref:Uncharacterized protein n=1 Tax=Siphoviridae sp. ctg8V11 TaxID=2827910 RepID=A0A8S5T4A6_9CAUD|nr:MAG TPA: hypothetical protein [Siphoviridae sp. ctg8V11]